ncbi:MAG: undecaprenyldiphospho-muramoylpentapeptide beta-N-acetylglucosaminyltransferase [Idiomarina sp.]|nr:undecaprenyldiphospho-muramoylpentapeptide beta-N-acetylglucosaminyltransferase [Idiomarina sp.]
MRVMITAGGTGGHVFPALAVAEAMRTQGWQVEWLGTAHRLEAEVVPKAGFSFTGVAQQGLRGNGIAGWLLAPFRLVQSVFKMRRFLRTKQPDLVLGFGGYTAGPAGVAAWSLGIPLVIHEQNAAAGLTNKLLARIATRVLVGFAPATQQLTKGEVVGNPVRPDILAAAGVARPEIREALRVLVLGGSLGAAHLNEVVPAAVQNWQALPLQIRHQTGKGRSAEVRDRYGAVQADVADFIEDMASAYSAADLVICRAGALTCSELAAVGVASVLVPYPHAVDNHQLLNAKALADADAAVIIEQHEFTVERLRAELEAFAIETSQLTAMGERAKQVSPGDAVSRIVMICKELQEQRQK